jgi:hypothetical protein
MRDFHKISAGLFLENLSSIINAAETRQVEHLLKSWTFPPYRDAIQTQKAGSPAPAEKNRQDACATLLPRQCSTGFQPVSSAPSAISTAL